MARRRRVVTVAVTDEEYDKIKREADAYGLMMAQYTRMMVLKGKLDLK